MLTRIYVDNFRSFTNFEFEPGRVNLLIGANGSGKSSLFDLMSSVVDLACQGAEVSHVFPRESMTRWDRREMQRVELDVTLGQGAYRYELVLRHPVDGVSQIVREQVKRDGRVLFAFSDGTVSLHNNDGKPGASFPFRGNRSFLAQIEQRPETRDLVGFLDFLSGTWTLQLDAGGMVGESAEEQETLDRDGANFASWYRHITQENPERAIALFDALKPVIPGFQTLRLASGGKGKGRDLVVGLSAGGVGYEVDFGELSDGQRALIALYALLEGLDGAGACLLLDEPEAHVGLTEVQPWLVALDDRWADHRQVFVISHHPEVLDYLAAGQPWLFDRPDGGPTRVRQAPFERESGLSASKQVVRGLVDGE